MTISFYQLILLKYREINYRLHLKVRLLHDLLYFKSRAYKRYSDSRLSEVIHRSVLLGFVMSALLAMALELLESR